MAQFVSDGGNLVKRAIKVTEYPRLFNSGYVHAECPTSFAVAGLSINPVMVKSTLG
jgi:hypothetical protein